MRSQRGGGPDAATRTDVHRRDRLCQRCPPGRPAWFGLHVHHRVLRSQGGLDTPENLILLCGVCHPWAHEHREDAEKAGYILPSMTGGKPANPAEHRVWSSTWDRWILLNPDWTVTLVEGERPWPAS